MVSLFIFKISVFGENGIIAIVFFISGSVRAAGMSC